MTATIDSGVLERAAEAVHQIDATKTGIIHTVTVTLDGQSGRALVRVESVQSADITLVVA